MAASALAWTLVLLAASGTGILLADAYGLFDHRSIVITSERGCGAGSLRAPDDVPPDAARHDLDVRAGTPFHVPVPEGEGRAARYEVHAGDNGVARARPDGTPLQESPHPYAGILGGCQGWPEGDAPESLGPFVAERDGRVTAYAWRIPGSAS